MSECAASRATTEQSRPKGAPVAAVSFVWGPAVDAPVLLAPGRYVLGRAAGADIRIDDDAVEAHHAVLDIGPDGEPRVVQLAGRVPIRIDGVATEAQPCSDRVATGRHAVTTVSTIDLGATRLRIDDPPPAQLPVHTGEVPGEVGARMVMRAPRRVPPSGTLAVTLPPPVAAQGDPHPTAAGLGAAVVALIGSVVMATVIGHPMFAVFGLFGALASLATWVAGRVRHGRRSAAARRQHELDMTTFADAVRAAQIRARRHHLEVTPTPSDAIGSIDAIRLWERRPDHGDAFVVSLGVGAVHRPIAIEGPDGTIADLPDEVLAVVDRGSTLDDVPVDVTLDDRDRLVLAVTGPNADALIRSIVVQLAVQTGPADWCLVVVSDRASDMRWVECFPHARDAVHSAVIAPADPHAAESIGRLAGGDGRRLVVLCDQPALLATRTSPLRRLLDAGERPVTVLLEVPPGTQIPAVCSASLQIGLHGTARWHRDHHADHHADHHVDHHPDRDAADHRAGHDAGPQGGLSADGRWPSTRLRVAGVSAGVARRTGLALRDLVDPEDDRMGASALPTDLRLSDLPDLPACPERIARMWAEGGDDPTLRAPIGWSATGAVEIDLVDDGPHGLIAGTTGAGKSELLRTLVVALAARVSPDHLTFVLVDYKGGSTFDSCADLPHTVGLVTDLDDGLATRALVSLEAELHRREQMLRSVGAPDLSAYRARSDVEPLPRLVVVIDEFAALAKELPHFLSALVGIAQRGRSLGVHLLLATQRPTGVVDDAIRANTNLRLALRLHDVADAMDVVGDPSPAVFPRATPGRALMRLGPVDAVEFQAARCTVATPGSQQRTELDALVDAIRSAVERSGVKPPHRPWLPPLPAVLPELSHDDAVGLVDDPRRQRQLPLRWRRGANLALLGALGSGTTTTLATLLTRRVGTTPESELYVVDARGDRALDALDTLPQCAGVIRLHELERLHRVLAALTGIIDERRASTGTTAVTGHTDAKGEQLVEAVLAVDGLGALRRSLDDVATSEMSAALDRVLAEGPSVGVVTVAVVEPDASAASVLTRFADRWVFHLDDPSHGPLFGVPTARVPGSVPGRLVVASSGLDAQVALVGPAAPSVSHALPPGGTTRRVAVLPPVVSGDALGRATVERGTTSLPVGVRFDDLSVATMQIAATDHLLVLGRPRSGRSSALAHIGTVWHHAHPAGRVWVLCGTERSPLAAHPGRRPSVAQLCSALEVGSQRPHLVLVDDAERVADVDGALVGLVSGDTGSVTLVASARPDVLRGMYGHWTEPIRRSRMGLVMAGDADGELLATTLPRRCPVAARPGLAWMLGGGEPILVQVALARSVVDDAPAKGHEHALLLEPE
jgi:DNA segregation ATPase FtsK/SpoIIIE, S-DNA-T family